MKRLAAMVLLGLALLLGLLVALPFSQPGSRLLAGMVSRYTPVSIEWGGGRLFGSFHLKSLQLDTDGLALEITKLNATFDPLCLWHEKICLPELGADSVVLNLLPSPADTDQGTASDQSAPLQLPVTLSAPAVRLKHLAVSWEGGSWQQQSSELNLALLTDGVRLSGRVDKALLSLSASDDSSDSGPFVPPEIDLPLTIELPGLVLNAPSWQIGEQTRTLQEITARARWSGTALQIDHLAAADNEWGGATLSGSIDFSQRWPLDAALQWQPGPILVLPQGLEPGPLDLSATGDLADLSLALSSTGATPLAARGHVDVTAANIPWQLDAQLSWSGELPLKSLLPAPDTLPAGLADVVFHSPLQAKGSGDLDVQALTVSATASGAGYQQAALGADLRYGDDILQLHSLTLEGAGQPSALDKSTIEKNALEKSALKISGDIRLRPALDARLQLNTPNLRLPRLSESVAGTVSGSLALEAALSPADSSPQAAEAWRAQLKQVDLQGRVNGLPAHIKGNLALDSRRLVSAGQLDIEVNGVTAQVKPLADGAGQDASASGGVRLDAQIADLGAWNAAARGQLKLSAELIGRSRDLNFSASAKALAWDSWQLNTLSASGALNLDHPKDIEASVTAGQLGRDSFILDSAELALQTDASQRSFRLQTTGDVKTDLQAELHADGESEIWRGELQPALITFPAGQWQLAQQASLQLSGQALTIGEHCWQGSEGKLCFEQSLVGPSGEVKGDLQGTLALLQPFTASGVSLSGPLGMDLQASWSPEQALAAKVQINSEAGQISQQLDEEGKSASWDWDQLAVVLNYRDSVLDLVSHIQRDGRQVLQLQLQLPASSDQALDGEAQLQGLRIGALQPFVAELAQLDGTLDGQWRFAGTPAAPQLQGQLQLKDAAIAVSTTPTALSELNATLDFNGSDITLSGQGKLGEGPVTLDGSMQLQPWALTLALKGQGNHMQYPPSLEAVANPDLRLSVKDGLVELKGTVDVVSGGLHQEHLPEGSVNISRDVVQVDARGKPVATEQPFDAKIDLRVSIKEGFEVQVLGMDAEVGGELQVQQQPKRLLALYGNLTVAGGNINAYGQHLVIKQGRISFSGLPENPDLDLRAERDIPMEQVTAGVHVQGNAEAPQLTIYSTPPMSQAAALSYLIRGRGLDSGTGMDGAALALSLGTGIVNRSALVDGLNRLPGLNNVEFGAETIDDDTAATVSGYIGERIYLSYGVGLYEPVSVVTARFYLSTRLWLEVVSQLENSVDLYYRFEIE